MILFLVIGIGAGIFIGYHEFAPKYTPPAPTVTPIKNDDWITVG